MPPPNKAADFPPVSPSKLSPPALPKILARSRLQTLFEQNEDKKLVLIIGQAAQGKTTAAAWYFQNSQRPSVWINLGPEDSDPVNLFHLLVSAVAAQVKEVDINSLHSLPSQRLGPRESRYNYREWAAALFKTFDRPFQLFLDGLDRLDPKADSFGFLQALVEALPPLVRLLLTARAYPPLSFEFQTLKMGRQALLLQNEDLAFSPPEIKQFFRELHGLSLVGEQVERIHKATEGWIGGIILLAQCLERLPESSVKEYLTHRLPDRFQREAFQFFGKEAFSTLTPSQQNLLLRSSLLDRLESGILKELFPDEEALELLKRLARGNLFVTGFPDPRQGMVFHLHQMFKEFLLTLLQSSSSEDEIRKLHSRAGDYYKKKGDEEEALRQYLEARSYPEAVELIKQVGLPLAKKARLADLSRWLDKLPKPLIQEEPWLLLFLSLTRRYTAPLENLRDLKKAIPLFRRQGDRSGLMLGLAFLIEAEVLQGLYRPEFIRETEELLQSQDEDACTYERAILWSQIGLVQAVRGNPIHGYWSCRKAYQLANRLGDLLLQVATLSHAVSCLARLGEFRQAERLLQEMNPLLWRLDRPEVRVFYSLSRIPFLMTRGDIEEALELCDTTLAELEENGLTYLYPYVLLYKQTSLTYARKYEWADQVGRQILVLAGRLNQGFLKGVCLFILGVSAYWDGRLPEARETMDQAVALLGTGDSRSEGLLPRARLCRSLMSDRPEDRPAAIQEVRELLEYFQSNSNPLLSTESHLALGILYHDSGRDDQARGHLQKGFDLARQRGYHHFISVSPRDALRACLLAQELLAEKNAGAEYAAGLVVRKYSREAGEGLEKLSRHPHPPVSQKAWEMRRSIHRATAPLLRIQTFGGLQLYFNTEPMEDEAWDRFQPRQLLGALLSQKNVKIQREVLIEALWPEELPATGEKNFKTTLQRLRKSLEPDLNRVFGSSYIHLHHNQIFLDETLCQIDSQKFVALYKEGGEKEKSGDGPGALDCFVRALDLYQGDFIPEERYAPWVEQRREDLKNIYIDLLSRTARYHEKAGAFKKAAACLKQVLEADPLQEEAYRNLMSLYAGRSQYNEAIRVYETCQKSLQAGLDSQPDPVTAALYRGIKERLKKS